MEVLMVKFFFLFSKLNIHSRVLRTVNAIYLNPITHLASYLLGVLGAYVTLNRPQLLRYVSFMKKHAYGTLPRIL